MSSSNDIQLMANEEDARAKLYAEIDPPPPSKSTCEKVVLAALNLPLVGGIFSFPFVEDVLRSNATWGYKATAFGNLPQLYGLVIICCVILPNFVKLWVGFAITGKGRKTYGYKNPVHCEFSSWLFCCHLLISNLKPYLSCSYYSYYHVYHSI